MNQTDEKKYWMTVTTIVWVIILVVSFFVFFPAFVAFLIIWAAGKVKVTS